MGKILMNVSCWRTKLRTLEEICAKENTTLSKKKAKKKPEKNSMKRGSQTNHQEEIVQGYQSDEVKGKAAKEILSEE